jgi:hypothetical protein
MEKECCDIKVTETDEGFRIDVKGKALKEMGSCCCIPVMCVPKKGEADCCPSDEKE